MSNQNAPFGLKPLGKVRLGCYNSTGTTEYEIANWYIWKHFFRRPSKDGQHRRLF